MNDQLQENYDAIPYGSEVIPGAHPAHLATIAKLLNLNPPAANTARILELGCAQGENIMSIACSLPESSCIGIDLSPRQIDSGNQLLKSAALPNVKLQVKSILDITPDLGTFDYIISHGIFSWVPTIVQDKILDICANNLSQNGIAYISYNTFPGWHIRGSVREMMLFETLNISDPAARATRAKKVLQFMNASLPKEGAFGALLREEISHPLSMPDWYLSHDYMEQYNDPQYFYRFMQRCSTRGLYYLGDSEVPKMFPQEFAPGVRELILQMSEDQIAREQYTDYLRNRMFRRTILTKHATTGTFDAEQVATMYVSSPLVPNSSATNEVAFSHPNGGGIRSPQTVLNAALNTLHSIWPMSMYFPDLVAKVNQLHSTLATETVRSTLLTSILTCYSAGLVNLALDAVPFNTEINVTPKASSFARAQALQGAKVSTLQHDRFILDALDRKLITLLDGVRSLESIGKTLRGFSSEQIFASVQKMARAGLIVHG